MNPSLRSRATRLSVLSMMLMLSLVLFQCGKKEDTPPDAGAEVAGKYDVIQFVEAGVSDPLQKGWVVLNGSRVSETKAKFTIDVNFPTIPPSSDDFIEVDLKRSGSTIEFYVGTTQVGSLSGKQLEFSGKDEDGVDVRIVAEKQ